MKKASKHIYAVYTVIAEGALVFLLTKWVGVIPTISLYLFIQSLYIYYNIISQESRDTIALMFNVFTIELKKHVLSLYNKKKWKS